MMFGRKAEFAAANAKSGQPHQSAKAGTTPAATDTARSAKFRSLTYRKVIGPIVWKPVNIGWRAPEAGMAKAMVYRLGAGK